MRAIDTNVVVRFLTADDPRQAKAAKATISAGDIFVSTTVVLESEWVLRAGYGLGAYEVAAGLRGLAGLPGVEFEAGPEVAQALYWMCEGMDFADALHLVQAGHCSAFVTFDRKLAKKAKSLSMVPIEIL